MHLNENWLSTGNTFFLKLLTQTTTTFINNEVKIPKYILHIQLYIYLHICDINLLNLSINYYVFPLQNCQKEIQRIS